MLKIGVIGCGRRVYGLLKDHLRALAPDMRVVGVLDPNREAVMERLEAVDRETVAFYDSVADLAKGAQPDALVIGTHCREHAAYACEAVRFGLPIFLEKPIAINMTQAMQLEEAFLRYPCPTVVSFPLRVSPLCELTDRYIKEGKIGTPEHIEAWNYVGYGTVYFEDFYRDYSNTQGLFLQKATHDLDYMMMLMNSPVVRVGAMKTAGRVFGGDKAPGLRCSACAETETCLESPANRLRNESSYTTEDHWCVFSRDCGSVDGGMNEDSSSALLEFASGVHGVYTQVFFVRRDAAKRGARISGYQGSLDFDWVRNDLRYYRHHEPFSDHITASANLAHFGGDRELARDFLKLIQSRIAPRSGIVEGLRSVYTCLAAKESAETGSFVAVRQPEL